MENVVGMAGKGMGAENGSKTRRKSEYTVKLRKSGLWEIPECRADLHRGTVDRFSGPWKMLQCRVRTWLQLMGCALVLELGVLISEQV